MDQISTDEEDQQCNINIHQYWQMTADVSKCLWISANIGRYQLILTNIGRHYRRSVGR